MAKLADLVGKEISGGWRVERWYEIKVHWQTRNKSGYTMEYYPNLETAQAAGIMAGKDEKDVEPQEIFVMTQDGKTGIPLSDMIKASTRSLSEVEDEKKKNALDKLSLRAQELLAKPGHKNP
jgi:hypothetical protein